MNPLKERRTVTTTKAITTLFICSALLVGFMGMSLGLSQTASAQPEDRPTPQCPEGDFDQGGCTVTTVTCPPGFDPVRDDSGTIIDCTRTVTETPTCPGQNREFRVVEGRGVCWNTAGDTATGQAPRCNEDAGFRLNEARTQCEKTETADPIVTTKTIRPGQGPEREV